MPDAQTLSVTPYREPRKPKGSGSYEVSYEALSGGHWPSLTNCVGVNLLEAAGCADVSMLFDKCSSRPPDGIYLAT